MKKTKLRHILAAVLFCMVMSIGFVCLADEQATVNVKNAVIRASADPNSEKIGSVPQGKTVDVISQTTGTDGKKWYQVYVDGDKKGYIRGDLLKLKDGANVKNDDTTPAAPAQNTDAKPAASGAKKGTVSTNNVRIRKGASTTDDVVATANRGMVVTVTGETNGSDGKNWYQISFTYNNKEITGFIRSDLVTFDNVPADVAQTQITGSENAGNEQESAATEPAETEPVETEPKQEPQAPSNAKEVTPTEPADEPYVMPGFTLFDLVDGEQKYTAYKNGSFYIIYGRRNDGEEGWFLFDSEKGIYTRYPYMVAGVETAGNKTVSILVVIVLVAVIVVLAAIVGILLIKLLARSREDDSYGGGYGRGKKDYQDDDLEDLEELELGDEGHRPSPNVTGRPPQGRRPQPGAALQEQPQGRRPQPQGPVPHEQPQGRRPQPQGGNPQARPRPSADEQPQGTRPSGGGSQQAGGRPQAGGQPQGRRPQPQGPRPSGGGSQQAGGRPQAGGQPQGRQPQPHRRPPQSENVPPQKGQKAKNPDQGEDDMEFMDI